MKFCDKLPKLRKENNLSQELLADRLGVSRQAVSKWESGSSYPDMEKMIEICKVLNCTLEDLLDDGAIGSNSFNKFNLNNYFNDFLKFVTKTYNMFCAMKFTTKIKCLIEMAFITFVLWLVSFLVFAIFDNLLFDLFSVIPKIGYLINCFFENVFILLLFLVSFIIFIHLFKIRYLDYYITIFDQNIGEKVIEEPLDEVKKEMKGKKEKIIIRDPEHSRFSFFDFLARIVVGIIKIMFFLIGIFFVLTFTFLAVLLFIMLYHIKYGIIFLFAALALIGVCLLNYVVVCCIYNFLVSRKINHRIIFTLIILGILIFGAGIGLSFSTYLSFNKTDKIPDKYLIKEEVSIDMRSNLVIDYYNVKYIIDDSVKEIVLKSSNGLEKVYFDEYDYLKYNMVSVYTYNDDFDFLNLLYDDIKSKNTRDYLNIYDGTVYIYVSRDNYNKLMSNYKKYLNSN